MPGPALLSSVGSAWHFWEVTFYGAVIRGSASVSWPWIHASRSSASPTTACQGALPLSYSSSPSCYVSPQNTRISCGGGAWPPSRRADPVSCIRLFDSPAYLVRDLALSHFCRELWLSPEGRPARMASTEMSSSKSGQ